MNLPLWHLTENPHWRLDPEFRPRYAYFTASEVKNPPGLYVTEHPVYWSSYFGRGPIWAVRVGYHDELPRAGEQHPEYLLTNLDKIEILEILPLSKAIERGSVERIAESRREIKSEDMQYQGFGGIEDWWFTYKEIWDDKKMRLVTVRRARKGLEKLMVRWKKEHPGYKDSDDYWKKKYG